MFVYARVFVSNDFLPVVFLVVFKRFYDFLPSLFMCFQSLFVLHVPMSFFRQVFSSVWHVCSYHGIPLTCVLTASSPCSPLSSSVLTTSSRCCRLSSHLCVLTACFPCVGDELSPSSPEREREREREIVSSYVMYISYNTYSWIVLPNRICSHPHSMSACACFVCFHTQRAEALFDVLYVALFCKLDSWTDLGAYAHAFMLKVCHYTRQCARDSFYVISICHAENIGQCFSWSRHVFIVCSASTYNRWCVLWNCVRCWFTERL